MTDRISTCMIIKPWRQATAGPLARYVRRSALLGSVAVMLLVGACVPRNGAPERSQLKLGSPADVAEANRYWGDRFAANPGDEKSAYAYSRALVAQDQRAQAVAVLQKAVLANGSSSFLKGELGKAMAANGQFNEALSVLAQAHSPERPDWRLLSAQGAIYDQIGRSDTAREHYQAALVIAPGEPSILSNLGLSYALTGDLARAETFLRQSTATGKADERARQNLAIVVGLQGRFDEAQIIARQDLPPEQAEKNIQLLRSMLSQANTWNTIRGGGPPATQQPAPADSAASGKTAPLSLLQR